MDTRTERNILSLHPGAQPKFRAFMEAAQTYAAAKGYEYKAICGTRTWDEQKALYAQGRDKNGNRIPGAKVVTNAKPGSSFHNFGLAIDCGVFKDGVYLDDANPDVADRIHREVSAIAKRNGLRWGGDFKSITDMPHFELDTPLTLAQLRDFHDAGKPFNV